MHGDIIERVVEHYIATGKGMTVRDISEVMGLKEATIRKAVSSSDALVAERDFRPSYGSAYGVQIGGHWVSVYIPTRERLVQIIRSQRGPSQVAA